MNELSVAIAFGALMVTIFTFVATQLSQKRFAEKGYVDELNSRLEKAEEQLAMCRRESSELSLEIQRLREHNYRLMLRVTEIEKKNG